MKAALPFIEAVRINGLPPTNPELVGKYLSYVSVVWELQALQKLWPFTEMDITDPVGTARSVKDDFEKFNRYLDTIRRMSNDLKTLNQHGFDIQLGGLDDLEGQLATLNRADEADRSVEVAEREYHHVSGLLSLRKHQGPRYKWIDRVESAIEAHDGNAYEEAISAATAFHRSGLERQRFLELLGSLRSWSHELASKIEDPTMRGAWGPCLEDRNGSGVVSLW